MNKIYSVLTENMAYEAANCFSIVAITSTTILPLDGLYEVSRVDINGSLSGHGPAETRDSLNNPSVPVMALISGTPHYIGHPATKAIVEGMGAVPSSTKLFSGLNPGEAMLCCAIKQGMSDRSQGGTAVNQEVTPDMLDWRLVVRYV